MEDTSRKTRIAAQFPRETLKVISEEALCRRFSVSKIPPHITSLSQKSFPTNSQATNKERSTFGYGAGASSSRAPPTANWRRRGKGQSRPNVAILKPMGQPQVLLFFAGLVRLLTDSLRRSEFLFGGEGVKPGQVRPPTYLFISWIFTGAWRAVARPTRPKTNTDSILS